MNLLSEKRPNNKTNIIYSSCGWKIYSVVIRRFVHLENQNFQLNNQNQPNDFVSHQTILKLSVKIWNNNGSFF